MEALLRARSPLAFRSARVRAQVASATGGV